MKRLALFISLLPCLLIGRTQQLKDIHPFTLSTKLPLKVERTILFRTSEGSNMNVDISPNGQLLVFDLLGDLYVMPIGGGKAVQLTRGIPIHLYPVWSPKGDKIAFVSDA